MIFHLFQWTGEVVMTVRGRGRVQIYILLFTIFNTDCRLGLRCLTDARLLSDVEWVQSNHNNQPTPDMRKIRMQHSIIIVSLDLLSKTLVQNIV